jgi:hypothetical protein
LYSLCHPDYSLSQCTYVIKHTYKCMQIIKQIKSLLSLLPNNHVSCRLSGGPLPHVTQCTGGSVGGSVMVGGVFLPVRKDLYRRAFIAVVPLLPYRSVINFMPHSRTSVSCAVGFPIFSRLRLLAINTETLSSYPYRRGMTQSHSRS